MTFKAKDKDKDQTLKAKDQDKDQTYKDKDQDKDLTLIWPVKIVPDMTYNVFGGTLNPTLLLL